MKKKGKPLDPLLVTIKNIPAYPQNRVGLIVDDIAKLGVEPIAVQRVLMARGVNKWLEARRAIIRLKHSLKRQVTETIDYIVVTKKQKARPGHFGSTRRECLNRLYYARGYLKAIEEVRARLRAICRMHRWQPPHPDPLTLLPSTGVAQLAKIHDLQGELKDMARALEQVQTMNETVIEENGRLKEIVERQEGQIRKLHDA
jgi:hypothetical protein